MDVQYLMEALQSKDALINRMLDLIEKQNSHASKPVPVTVKQAEEASSLYTAYKYARGAVALGSVAWLLLNYLA